MRAAARRAACSSASAPRSTSTPASSRRRPPGCSGTASSGSSGSPTSRAGCGGATCATTRASWPASPASTRRAQRLRASLASRRHARRLGHRPRPRRPAARALLRRPRPARARRRQRRRSRSRRCAAGRMPFEEPGTAGAARRASHASDACSSPTASPTPRGPTHIVLTLGTPSFSHIEIDMRDIRSVLDDLLPVLRAGPLADRCARPSRPGTTEFVAGYLEQAPRLRGRRGRVRRARARADRRRTLPRGDRHAAVHRRRRRRRARASAPRELFEVFGAPIVQTTPVQAELAKIWTNILRYTHVRAAQPADDGLRALRRERVRRDRPDQPRLPARRDRAAGAHRRHLPAQGLRVLRGALERARACCSRVSRVHESRAAVPRRGR